MCICRPNNHPLQMRQNTIDSNIICTNCLVLYRGTQYIIKTNVNQWHHDLRLDATTFKTLPYTARVLKEQNFQCFHKFCVILKN